MTPDERDQVNALCAQIMVEQNHEKFSSLVDELNALLERQEGRLEMRASHS